MASPGLGFKVACISGSTVVPGGNRKSYAWAISAINNGPSVKAKWLPAQTRWPALNGI